MSAPQRNLVWVASYPKSGNTWVRFLLCNLLFGRLQSGADLSRYVPDIHELGGSFEPGPGALLIKTHFCYHATMALAARTAAAIYVVRDPLGVFASNYHYQKRRDVGGLPLEAYFEAFLRERGDPRWRALGMGSWDENVRSWLDPALPFPVLRLRYEDLLRDPLTAATTLARLVRPGIEAAAIARAVEHSSFARMREIEEADIRAQRVGIFYKPYLQDSIAAGLRFMRSGTPGDSATELSDTQRARLRAAFGALAVQLGYAGA